MRSTSSLLRVIEKLAGRPPGAVPTLVCMAALAVAGCGESEDSAGSPADTTAGAETADGDGTVAILDFKYDPDQVTVAAGSTVVWTNEDMADHTATADDDSFNTGVFGRGEEGEATLDEAGTFAYHCDLHPFMKGEVVVE